MDTSSVTIAELSPAIITLAFTLVGTLYVKHLKRQLDKQRGR